MDDKVPTGGTGGGLSGLERLRRMMSDDLRPGMAKTLDIRIVGVEAGSVTVEAVPGPQHYNPLGVVHGGYAATLLDFACGYTTLSMVAAGVAFTTLELKVAYHRPMTAQTGPVRAQGKISSMGRRTAFTEARLTDSQGRLYASATSTLLILQPG